MKKKLILVIIALNAAVFFAWMKASGSTFETEFMAANFLVSWTHLAFGREWVLITSVFSHNLLWHFALNMLVLYSFGPIVIYVIGAWRFLSFYIIAGIISSFSHAWVSAYILHDPSLQALGASGAIAGVIFLFALMFPKEKILLFGIVPVPAIIGGFLFLGLDLWGLWAQAGGGGLPIGHGAHLGGAATGIIYYLLRIRGRQGRSSYSA